jgi:ubiquitin carboxyl-terminal hydrolase 8
MEKQEKGLTGIANLGNTCFLNSCLQILNHTYELHEYADSEKCQTMLSQKVADNNIDAILFHEWNSLRKMMWSINGIVSPERFVQCVQHIAGMKNREIFTGWSQNDTCEFLLFMVECIHNSAARSIKMQINGAVKNETDKMAIEAYKMLSSIYSKEYSEIMDMFYGIYVTKLSDPEIYASDQRNPNVPASDKTNPNSIYSMIPAHYFIIDLEVSCASIYDGFDRFITPENLEGENAWFNEATGQKQSVMKECVFFTFPTIMVICLKRFSSDGKKKLQNLVDFPVEGLDLSRYAKGYFSNRYIYDLYGVANHMGSVEGGHYTAYVKHKCGEWLHYNDTEVSLLEKSKIVSTTAYCLFYRKRQ